MSALSKNYRSDPCPDADSGRRLDEPHAGWASGYATQRCDWAQILGYQCHATRSDRAGMGNLQAMAVYRGASS
jgi:hypothetical protein